MLAARQQQRIDQPLARYQRAIDAFELGAKKRVIEAGIVDHERRVADKGKKLVGDFNEKLVPLQELGGKTMDSECLGRDVAFRIEVRMKCRTGRYPVEQFDAAELDKAMALARIQAGGFGIENDFAHIAFQRQNHRRRFGIVAIRARISRTWVRAASKPFDVSTTKSARARLSASGICLARIAANFCSVMPERSATRSRCTSGGAETTTTASQRFSPPVSNRSGISSTATDAPLRSASARNRVSAVRTSGCTIASSFLTAAVSPSTRWLSLSRSTRPRAVVPGKAASMSGVASAS